ncbi:MAG TPA: NAD(P)-dependent oxidoreductase [Clostridiaceae bacterium]
MYLLSTFAFKQNEIDKLKELGTDVKLFNSEKELIDYEDVQRADAIIANHRTLQIDFLDRCKNLKWIQVPHIGIERLPMQYLKERKIIVTNARGIAGTPISEDIFCMMLMLARKSKDSVKSQLEHKWEHHNGVFNLYNKTIGLMGTGNVGTETAKKAKVFGMKTLGLNTTGQPLAYFDEVYKTCDVNRFLTQSDFIVCTIPPTKETINLIGEEQFKCMKTTAYIINISRAVIFKEEVLFDYLKNKKIAGAALDVFMEEFKLGHLPKESPFWNLDNLIITPHMAASGDGGYEAFIKIIDHNAKCFCSGGVDSMINIRDYDKGY